jgi:hypothetical protein
VGHLLLARQQQRAGAKDQPVLGEFDRPLLVAPLLVGKQGHLHVVHDSVAMKL